jgi:hypothetical protein
MATAAEMVEAIDDAILAALGRPRRFAKGPDQFEGLSLRELKELRREYSQLAAEEEAGGGCEVHYITKSKFDG